MNTCCPRHCSVLVDVCVEARRPAAARRAVEDMRAAGLRPDVVIFTALMAAYAAAGDVGRARGVLGEMRAEGVAPNVRTYTVLMQLMGDKGEWVGGGRWVALRGRCGWEVAGRGGRPGCAVRFGVRRRLAPPRSNPTSCAGCRAARRGCSGV